MKKVLSIIFYLVACFFLIIYFIGGLFWDITEDVRLMLILFTLFFTYFGGFFLAKHKNDNKIMKINLWIMFFMYLLYIVFSKFVINGFDLLINYDFSDLFEFINLVPFKIMFSVINDAIKYNGFYNLYSYISQFLLFIPVTIFLQLLLKKQTKFKNFFSTILIISIGSKLLQLLIFTAFFDIDEILLNILGATLTFFLLKINYINKLMRKTFFMECVDVNKRALIVEFIIVFFLLTCFFVKLCYEYIINLEIFPEYKIVDNTKEDCKEGLDLFYEDLLHRYYFKCQRNKDIYILMKGKKYSIQDFIDTYYDTYNETTILPEFYGEYLTGYKSSDVIIDFKIKKDSSSVSENYYISNQDIVSIIPNCSSFETNYLCDLSLFPEKEGSTLVSVTYEDEDTGSLYFKGKYLVIVDSDLRVSYIIYE